jgi:hypothetical protein
MLDSLSVKINVVLNDRRFLMMALLLALELGLVATPACSNFQAEALLLAGLLLLVLPGRPNSPIRHPKTLASYQFRAAEGGAGGASGAAALRTSRLDPPRRSPRFRRRWDSLD